VQHLQKQPPPDSQKHPITRIRGLEPAYIPESKCQNGSGNLKPGGSKPLKKKKKSVPRKIQPHNVANRTKYQKSEEEKKKKIQYRGNFLNQICTRD
jgi:hypothetical protein